MSNWVKWNALENSIYLHLRTYGPTVEKIKMLEWILYEEAFNLFGVIKKRNENQETIKAFKVNKRCP